MTMRIHYSFLMVCAICLSSCENEDESAPVAFNHYPTAEYHQARIALVCEPGEEFRFVGSSREGVSAEHRNLVDLLTQNGIETYNLRSSTSDNYHDTATGETWSDLSSCVYVRDPLISTPRGLVIGKMKKAGRQGETGLVVHALYSLGIPVIYHIQSEGAILEGGDYLPMGTFCLIGCGERTNLAAVRELMAADVLGVDTVVLVNDRSGNSDEMHLDTYLNAIDHDLMTLTSDRYDARAEDAEFLSVDIYARTPGSQLYELTVSHQPLLSFLQAHGISVIRIGFPDAFLLGGNFLCIGPRHIIASESLTAAFYDAMSENGVKVERIPTNNLRTGKGGIHCATQVISRDEE